MNYAVGDWVRSYSQGIWRIERVISDVYELRYSFEKPKVKRDQDLLILKRLVNDKWKRSLSMEVCSSSYITRLTENEIQMLNNFIINTSKTINDFEKYHRDIDLVLNLSFRNNDSIDFDSIANSLFSSKFEGNNGLSSDEILQYILESELSNYAFKNPTGKTIQFVSNNYEVSNSEFIFRSFRILDF